VVFMCTAPVNWWGQDLNQPSGWSTPGKGCTGHGYTLIGGG